MTYHCLCLGDRRGVFGRNYRCSSFGGHIAYIHHLFQRMLLSCGVWSAYGSLIACASWIEHLYVWEARFSSLTVFSVPVSLWNPRVGSGLAAGQGGPVCMHPSRSLGAVPGPTENASRNIPNTVCGLVGTFLISAKMFLLPCVLWAISGTISNMFLIPNNIRNTLSCSWYYVESFYNVPNMAMPILILW